MKKMLLISAIAAMLLLTGCTQNIAKNEIDAKKYAQLQFIASSTAAGKYEFVQTRGLGNLKLTLTSSDLVKSKNLIKLLMSDNIITIDEYNKIESELRALSRVNELKERDENKAILRQVLK